MPEEFRTALLSLREAPGHAGIEYEEVPPPRQLSPWSAALSLHTVKEEHGAPLASGRFVILYDPDSQLGWDGNFRIVAQLRTSIDPEMSTDPLLTEAMWNWAYDCLEEAGAGFHSFTGTVTKEMSESFGGLTLTDSTFNVELRASWSPSTPYLGEHFQGWLTLIGRVSGIILPRHLEEVKSPHAR